MAKFARKRLAKRRSKKDRDRLQRWLLVLVAILLVVYLGGAVLAPVLMKAGHTTQARRVYRTYQPACHQLAYRSFFLYGEQAVYPRDLAGVKGLKSYEAVTGLSAEDIESAKNFIGNEQLGYKTALCQRDLAILDRFFCSSSSMRFLKRESNRFLVALDFAGSCAHRFGWLLAGLEPVGYRLFGVAPSPREYAFPAGADGCFVWYFLARGSSSCHSAGKKIPHYMPPKLFRIVQV